MRLSRGEKSRRLESTFNLDRFESELQIVD